MLGHPSTSSAPSILLDDPVTVGKSQCSYFLLARLQIWISAGKQTNFPKFRDFLLSLHAMLGYDKISQNHFLPSHYLQSPCDFF
jgi:hypothetical protein